jgi:tryptophanase
MSDRQLAAMMVADDSYCRSETFTRLDDKLREIFGTRYFLPAHQGRACENLLSQAFVKPGSVVPMNYHFTTSKSHVVLNGGCVEELIEDRGLAIESDCLFKGNMISPNCGRRRCSTGRTHRVCAHGSRNQPDRGQPFLWPTCARSGRSATRFGLILVLDASLLADNLYFIKTREAACRDMSIRDITRAMADCSDIIYFSARKLGCARGGGICTNREDAYIRLREMVPLYEGFLTYGGMSVREMEAMTVGLDETMDEDMISQGPLFIEYMVNQLHQNGVPVVTPAGGLGCHVDAMRFVDPIPQNQYPAGALASALYIASGVRGMERGTLSEQRDPDGRETFSNMELLRLALPRRVFTLSQISYAVDRIRWLYENRRLIGGLSFVEEPAILRFIFGRLAPVSDWQQRLAAKFRADFGSSL